MPQEPGGNFEHRVARNHTRPAKGHHVPELIRRGIIQPFERGHVRPHEMRRHEPTQAERTKVEKCRHRPPNLKPRQGLFPVEEEARWEFVFVLDVAEEAGEEAGGEVDFGERWRGGECCPGAGEGGLFGEVVGVVNVEAVDVEAE